MDGGSVFAGFCIVLLVIGGVGSTLPDSHSPMLRLTFKAAAVTGFGGDSTPLVGFCFGFGVLCPNILEVGMRLRLSIDIENNKKQKFAKVVNGCEKQ